MQNIYIPPIKSQGIKMKFVEWIKYGVSNVIADMDKMIL
jgi:hypothetical protein